MSLPAQLALRGLSRPAHPLNLDYYALHGGCGTDVTDAQRIACAGDRDRHVPELLVETKVEASLNRVCLMS